LVKTLLRDLLHYYEINYFEKLNSDSLTKTLFDQVKEIERSLGEACKGLSGLISVFQEDFNSEYIDNQIHLMMDSIEKNPTETIGKAKELLETCCIIILENKGISIEKNWNVQKLSKQAIKSLKLTPDDIPDSVKASDTINRLLSNLASICGYMAELRNLYGSGHGKSSSYKGLSSRHARLAVGATGSVVSFLWETYKVQNA
jgi:regulator of replication initiation timing